MADLRLTLSVDCHPVHRVQSTKTGTDLGDLAAIVAVGRQRTSGCVSVRAESPGAPSSTTCKSKTFPLNKCKVEKSRRDILHVRPCQSVSLARAVAAAVVASTS